LLKTQIGSKIRGELTAWGIKIYPKGLYTVKKKKTHLFSLTCPCLLLVGLREKKCEKKILMKSRHQQFQILERQIKLVGNMSVSHFTIVNVSPFPEGQITF